MASHCFCSLCQASAARAPELQTLQYEVVTAPFPGDVTGWFVQFANDDGYTYLTGRELFGFPAPDKQLHVGISGIYYADYDPQVRAGRQLDLLGLGGRHHYAVRIAGDVQRNLFVTRAGRLRDGAELTLKIGCGGRVSPVAANTSTFGAVLTEGRYGYTVGRLSR